jgi:hypothetical protein
MVDAIRAIARKPFDGNTRKGPRHAHILMELRKRGCHPSVDRHGNIWVEKGSGKPTILFSSHLDVDPRIRRISFSSRKSGNSTVLSGVLDNAVGCYINLLLAQRGPKKGRAIYVFTASEEPDKKNPRRFARSAREVAAELTRRGIKPDFCIAVDVTYPRLLKPQHKLDWTKSYESLFDSGDDTHCYLDGFSLPAVRRLSADFMRRFRDRRVAARRFHGYDEACVYERKWPSFAFGPVVYGHFDAPDQRMPLSHLRTALRFLRSVEGYAARHIVRHPTTG